MKTAKQPVRSPAARPFVSPEEGPEGVFVVIGPSAIDDHELARLDRGRLTILRHDCVAPAGTTAALLGPLEQAEMIRAKLDGCRISGVISTDNYPGSILACIVAERLGLPGPRPGANLLCQHQYHSRLTQRALVCEAVPEFAAIDVALGPTLLVDLFPPFVLRSVAPIPSFAAYRVDHWEVVEEARTQCRAQAHLSNSFGDLLERFTPYRLSTKLLLVEELLAGAQVTLEGYAQGDEIYVFGVVDAVPLEGVSGGQRFEYPSTLPHPVQARMVVLARRLMGGIGYCDGLFNIEFTYNAESGRLAIVAMNPCLAPHLACLYEKVDGQSSYQILLDVAAGKNPELKWREGEVAYASVVEP